MQENEKYSPKFLGPSHLLLTQRDILISRVEGNLAFQSCQCYFPSPEDPATECQVFKIRRRPDSSIAKHWLGGLHELLRGLPQTCTKASKILSASCHNLLVRPYCAYLSAQKSGDPKLEVTDPKAAPLVSRPHPPSSRSQGFV
jgi:hypothetical protein